MAQEIKLTPKLFVGSPTDIGTSKERYDGFLMTNEEIIMEYKGNRDAALFTEKRLIIIDPQGLRGKKVAITSIPWKSVTAYSVENSGTFDLDAELKLCGSGFGICELEFSKGTDVKKINEFINSRIF
tara:strand:+ start:132 stop:512 length:381 start_codon:yes stop_codon:yes gene_type:complete